jgi:molybdopterin-guanine dinucleotide biosynthesis protein A
MQPLLGCYQWRALELLRRGAEDASRPLRESIEGLEPALLEVDDPDELFDVDSPDDLLQAAAMLDRRRLSAPY